jgi:hypothetical protein
MDVSSTRQKSLENIQDRVKRQDFHISGEGKPNRGKLVFIVRFPGKSIKNSAIQDEP